mmetsp:Transcript_89658/g.250408  ORF Transcript_89658/g.250408 Transcript_89658/m.250408 type:complete len:273 (+) Transcript_89658:573-1391(+)
MPVAIRSLPHRARSRHRCRWRRRSPGSSAGPRLRAGGRAGAQCRGEGPQEHGAHGRVELLDAVGLYDVHQPVSVAVTGAPALAAPCVERAGGGVYCRPNVVVLACTHHRQQRQSIVEKPGAVVCEKLHDAPQPLKVGRPAQDDHLPAAAEENWQASQVGCDVCLVGTALVDPNLRLTPVLGDESFAPPLQQGPLARRAVRPRMRDEGIALAQRNLHRPLEEHWVRVASCHLLLGYHRQVDAAKPGCRLCERLTSIASAEKPRDTRCGIPLER